MTNSNNLIDDIISKSIQNNKIQLVNINNNNLNKNYHINHKSYTITHNDISKLIINLPEAYYNIKTLKFLYIKVPIIKKSYL
jgi:hypothetical protein